VKTARVATSVIALMDILASTVKRKKIQENPEMLTIASQIHA